MGTTVFEIGPVLSKAATAGDSVIPAGNAQCQTTLTKSTRVRRCQAACVREGIQGEADR